MRKTILFSAIALLLCVAVSAASVSAIANTFATYKLTTSPDDNIQIGSKMTVTANTTNWDIDKVRFTWTDPSGHKTTETIAVTRVYDHGLYKYSIATSTHIVDKSGDWSIKAEFIDKSGFCCWSCDKTVKTKYVNFHVVPEVPILGTAGVAAAMILGLVVTSKRKHQKATSAEKI